MRRVFPRLRSLAGIVFSCLLANSAFAMVPGLPQVDGEKGVKAGDFRIWPRIALESGFDSNVFHAAEQDNYQKVGSPFLMLSPGLRVENPNGREIILSFDGSGSLRRFMSGDQTVDDPQSNFGGDVNLGIEFFPRRAASFEIYDTLSHRLETPNFSTTKTFNRLVNTAGAKLNVHPGGVGGRRALELSLGYHFRLENFVDFSNLNQSEQNFRFFGSWKFFPKTALFTDVQFALRSWDQTAEASGRTNSSPTRGFLGLSGYVTKKVSTTVKLGYGAGNYEIGQDFAGILGEATVAYSPYRTTVLSAGYTRDFRDSLYANFYGQDRFNLRAMQQFLGRFNVRTELAYTLIDFSFFDPSGAPTYGDTFVVVNTTDRQDASLDVNTSLEFEVTRYLAFQLSYQFTNMFSDFEERTSTDSILSEDDVVIDVGGYDRHVVLGGVRLQY